MVRPSPLSNHSFLVEGLLKTFAMPKASDEGLYFSVLSDN
ncbi:hypothetical protein BBEV_1638 [Salisediminibacterium beveridgei]|uniref:Uncharacterized protein n=1 Tax=Salisediminibacterium beveridgei TaxID=632773 RepID=A0A1D7QVJ7_9BACI|nr:hypothetical protein BBEV_1638 [Salisediminibacterium beveridgei]